jgi:hypothetical protein
VTINLVKLINNIKLMQAGFPPTVLRKQERKSYYTALEKADEGDIEPLATMIANDAERALDLWLGTFE